MNSQPTNFKIWLEDKFEILEINHAFFKASIFSGFYLLLFSVEEGLFSWMQILSMIGDSNRHSAILFPHF